MPEQDIEENIAEFFRLILEKQGAGIKSRFTIENIHTVKKTSGKYEMQINYPSSVCYDDEILNNSRQDSIDGPLIKFMKVSDMNIAELEIAREWCAKELTLV